MMVGSPGGNAAEFERKGRRPSYKGAHTASSFMVM